MKTAVIISKTKISDGTTSVRQGAQAGAVYDMRLYEPETAGLGRPGQFISIYLKDGSRLLPRPISICETDKEAGNIRIVFRIAGGGTRELASYPVSDALKIMGPLGNGFMLEDMDGSGTAVLFGGGIGIPPMLALAKNLKGKKKIILGYRNEDTFLSEEFKSYGEIFLSTEDGSRGIKGNVIHAVKELGISGDMAFACGPLPMLKGVKEWAGEKGIKAQLSMEEHMACGIGACLACVCRTKEVNPHTNVHNARVCKDGPVFYAEDMCEENF